MRSTLIEGAYQRERGQTIVLVALSLVTLLAMAALAIDVVTLYVARGEAQRAADAAALAGAKAFVDSGVTTDPSNTTLRTLAQNVANAFINGILPQNKIAGVQPTMTAVPTFDFTQDGNPKITVTLQRTNLPIFFARIWGTSLATVTATATAEAYNPSNSQTITGNLVPIAPKCVKPWLMPNDDPNGGTFVSPTTGAVSNPTGVIGETFTLTYACPNGPNPCVLPPSPPPAGQANYLPAVTANTPNLCPSCAGTSNYEQNIECCDFNVVYSCGGASSTANVDTAIIGIIGHQDTHQGVQCLINGGAQDTLDATNFPTGPMEITAGSGPHSGQLVTTSSSIVTIPIFDPASLDTTTGQVNIIGFLQAFINSENGSGDMNITVLNVVGCGNSPGSTPAVSGGGVTPIPVRLIHN
jgi:Flp pilus assembly protein TadG